MKKTRVAINGFGRIGRAFFKLAQERKDALEIVAVNDLGDIENAAYLLKYDTAYGKSPFDIQVKAGQTSGDASGSTAALVVDGVETLYLNERDPSKLPWATHAIDIVIESTGVFETYEKAKVHLAAGAKKVVITAPVKDAPPDGISAGTILVGINEEKLATCQISSNGSCTTNAGSPLIQVLSETVGIEKALLNTVHAHTATQSIVDGPTKGDFRRGRAAGHNIVPSSTGAAIATTKAITELDGLFDGVAVRVPVITGSMVDVTFIAKRDTTAEEINQILEKAAGEKRWEGILGVTREQLVSSDIIGSPFASLVDLAFTRVVGGNLVKVLAWYDNEMGYTYTLLRHVLKAGESIQ